MACSNRHFDYSISIENMNNSHHQLDSICECQRVTYTKIVSRNSSLIFVLLILSTIIALAKLCAPSKCILHIVTNYVLLLLITISIGLEIHMCIVVRQSQNEIQIIINKYFSNIMVTLGNMFSFEIIIGSLHLTTIVLLLLLTLMTIQRVRRRAQDYPVIKPNINKSLTDTVIHI
ncbi:unnamed protein product [Didymodactylos carnosus]|nr:unnamed protein product [Didymodactylos carnosus]CAF4416275.1 unnamed protein product [Didymodactylos carnosus]